MTDETNDDSPVLLEGRFVTPAKIPGRRLPGLGRKASLALVGGAVVAGFAFGINFPDVDFDLPLPHRSGITHSILPILLACLLLRKQMRKLPALRYLMAGYAGAIGIHLLADLFPAAWTGGALIYLPLVGSIGGLSLPFLLINAILALGIAVYSCSRRGVPISVITALGFSYFLFNESSLGLGLLWLSGSAAVLYAHKRGILDDLGAEMDRGWKATREYVRDRDFADIAGDCLENVAKAASRTAHATDEKARAAAKKARTAHEYFRVRDPADIAGDCLEKADQCRQKAAGVAKTAGKHVRDHKITKVVAGTLGQGLEKAGQTLQKV